jgi:hypothetical protein
MCRGIEPTADNLISAIEGIEGTHDYQRPILNWEEVVTQTEQVYESE